MAKKFGTDNRDIIHGTDEADTFYSYAGDDDVFGGKGNDLFISGLGYDYYNGGEGLDTVSYANVEEQHEVDEWNGIWVDLRQGLGGEVSSGNGYDAYNSIENITGSNFNDEIHGDGLANVLKGLDGNDYLEGLAGNDTLLGGDGDDVIEGGAGADTLDGGAGWDTVSYASSSTGVYAYLNGVVVSNAYLASSPDSVRDVLTNFESLRGSNYGDHLYGGYAAEIISGLDGADYIDGGAGDDVLYGGAGNDTIKAGFGSDVIVGGDGDDVMSGLWDDDGRDSYVFVENTDSGNDRITDFDIHEDRILFDVDDNGGSYKISAINVNTITMTCDVVIDFGNAGKVTLEHLTVAQSVSVEDCIVLI